ncbi:MAG: carboxypeptidase-like regulatory domain-containing protein [Kibdelosporangium sp.]
MRTAKLGAVVTAFSLLSTPVALAADPPPQAELKVEAAFDKTAYTSGALVKLTLRVTNIGPVAAEKVTQQTDSGSNFWPNAQGWGELESGKGALINPGEVRVFEVSMYLHNVVDAVSAKGKLLSPTASLPVGPMWDLSSPVRAATGGWHGVVYGDTNNNGTPDPGEYLAGADIYANGGAPYKDYKTVTDAAGRFEFVNLPTGRYNTFYYGPNGGLLYGSNEQIVEEGESGETVVRGLRPLSDRLKVSLIFWQNTYQAGQTVRANVLLSNLGGTPINGITTDVCNGVGDPNQLAGDPAGWGPLAWNAAGVDLAPGETRIITVKEKVPAAAREWGEVAGSCTFGTDNEDPYGFPTGFDAARVPGLHSDIKVQVTHAETHTPVAGVQVSLTDRYTKQVVARPVSDAEGRFQLHDLQVGYYDVTYGAPWQGAHPGNENVRVRADSGGEQILQVRQTP